MEPTAQIFRESTQAICTNYLQTFPNEKERLQTLQSYLNNPELDLRLRTTIPEGHICSSGILLLPGGKVLMLHHKALNIWVVPGGHYDITDGPISNAAIRETIEETGITIPVSLHPWHLQTGIPLDIDTHPIPRNDKKDEDAHQHFDFRYVLTVDDPEQVVRQLSLDAHEVTAFTEMPIQEINPASSIAPAIKKLGLLSLN
jgi:8-oxo-dGTP pyrophosphatase MutT (NUDIX family)